MLQPDPVPVSAEGAPPLAAAVRYDTWTIASKLGANKADDYRDQAARHQVTLTNHRWRWFASRPREWREELQVIVNLMLLQHLEEHSPGADEDTVQRLKDAVHDALWQDRGSLAALKERAVHLHNAGEDECRKNDQHCVAYSGEWILDLVLEEIVHQVVAQGVDDDVWEVDWTAENEPLRTGSDKEPAPTRAQQQAQAQAQPQAPLGPRGDPMGEHAAAKVSEKMRELVHAGLKQIKAPRKEVEAAATRDPNQSNLDGLERCGVEVSAVNLAKVRAIDRVLRARAKLPNGVTPELAVLWLLFVREKDPDAMRHFDGDYSDIEHDPDALARLCETLARHLVTVRL